MCMLWTVHEQPRLRYIISWEMERKGVATLRNASRSLSTEYRLPANLTAKIDVSWKETVYLWAGIISEYLR